MGLDFKSVKIFCMRKKFELNVWVAAGVLFLTVALSFGLGGRYNGVVPGLGISLTPASSEIDFASLNQLYHLLTKHYDGELDKTKLLDGAKAGLSAAAGDPYTSYLTQAEAKQLGEDLAGTLSGIGAEIGLRSGRLVVVSPIADSPAEKAGLKAKDEILRIDDTDSNGLSLDQAVAKIRGPKDTTVKLKISRGGGEPFDVAITRTVITVASVKSSMKGGEVGYIQITRFGNDTVDKLDEAALELKRQGAVSIVLDLRNNPGGYLDGSVGVSSQFLSGGRVVVEERQDGKIKDRLTSRDGGRLIGVPMVALINGGSASASEIVAGALQDHKVATLLGEKSFGKGSVQELFKLGGGAELKITIAHWYTPGGRSIDKEGIKPDIEVKLEQADVDAGRDPQLDRAIEILKSR